MKGDDMATQPQPEQETRHVRKAAARRVPNFPSPETVHFNRAEQLERELTAAKAEIEALRVKIGKVALDYAERHDWCDVARQAVEEMGGIWPEQPKWKITLRAEWDVEIECTSNEIDANAPNEFILNSLDSSKVRPPEFDSDWDDDNSEVELIGVQVVKAVRTDV